MFQGLKETVKNHLMAFGTQVKFSYQIQTINKMILHKIVYAIWLFAELS